MVNGMRFSDLEDACIKYREILVIGKTIEHDGKKCHIVGMTFAEGANLYIIEPFHEMEVLKRRSKSGGNMRKRLKEQRDEEFSYLQSREIQIGSRKLQVQGGNSGSLMYSEQDYRSIQLFMDMINAGWSIPDWLKNAEWDTLQLVTLNIKNVKRLPKYSPGMPVTIRYRSRPIRHLLGKTLTLEIGKSRSFRFTDAYGEDVCCYINAVTLIDVWEDTAEQLEKISGSPKYTKKFTPEQLQKMKENMYEALKQNCPKGMCYIGIEYECTKEFHLDVYSKEYLKSYPEVHQGSSSFLLMHLKPDKKTGTHNLPLKGTVIQTPFPADTIKVSAEVFAYTETVPEGEEYISTGGTVCQSS